MGIFSEAFVYQRNNLLPEACHLPSSTPLYTHVPLWLFSRIRWPNPELKSGKDTCVAFELLLWNMSSTKQKKKKRKGGRKWLLGTNPIVDALKNVILEYYLWAMLISILLPTAHVLSTPLGYKISPHISAPQVLSVWSLQYVTPLCFSGFLFCILITLF